MKSVRFRDASGITREGEVENKQINVGSKTYAMDEVELLPPSEPRKIVCAGINHPDIFDEVELTRPEKPFFFFKPLISLAGPHKTIELPGGYDEILHEGEIAAIIGKECQNVSSENASDVIAGFTCINDLTILDNLNMGDMYDWVRTKAFDGSAVVGPTMATPDDVPSDAQITVRVNGEVKQQAGRDEYIFPIEELIEEVSSLMTLERGDVIAMGTPPGISPLEPGDTVEVEVEGIGVLEHDVAVTESSEVN